MRRVKSFAISSTVSHMLSQGALIGILVLMMSLAFLVQIILVGKYYAEGSVSRIEKAFQERTIAWSLLGAGPEQIERFIEEIQAYQGRINEIILSSDYTFPPSDGLPTEKEKEIRLVTFFPGISGDREIVVAQGSLDFHPGKKELFIHEHLYMEEVINGHIIPADDGQVAVSLRIRDELWNCIGVGWIAPFPGEFGDNYAVVDFSVYPLLSGTSDMAHLVFVSKPSKAEIDSINRIAERCLPVEYRLVPIQQEKGSQSDFFMKTGTVIVMVFALIINVLSVFDYLLSLRNKEFQVYLLTGGTINTIWLYSLLELTIAAALSVILGGLLIIIPTGKSVFGFEIWNVSPVFFLMNAGAFLFVVWLGFSLRMVLGKGAERFSYAGGGAT